MRQRYKNGLQALHPNAKIQTESNFTEEIIVNLVIWIFLFIWINIHLKIFSLQLQVLIHENHEVKFLIVEAKASCHTQYLKRKTQNFIRFYSEILGKILYC